jgi:hypothetical protein
MCDPGAARQVRTRMLDVIHRPPMPGSMPAYWVRDPAEHTSRPTYPCMRKLAGRPCRERTRALCASYVITHPTCGHASMNAWRAVPFAPKAAISAIPCVKQRNRRIENLHCARTVDLAASSRQVHQKTNRFANLYTLTSPALILEKACHFSWKRKLYENRRVRFFLTFEKKRLLSQKQSSTLKTKRYA